MSMNITVADLILISPMIAIFISSLVPITIKVLRGNREQNPISTMAQVLIGLLIAGGLTLVFVGSGKTAFSHGLRFDGLTLSMSLITIGSAIVTLFMLHENPATRGEQFSELVFLFLSSVLGMLILSAAVDLLLMFIGIETMSLSLYLMIAMSHEEKLSKEAAIKYFVLGSFASAIFLYGISYIYGAAGTTNLLEFYDRAVHLIQVSKIFLIGFTLVMLGFSFKVSIVPFHAWTPDVYQGSPTPFAGFMATAVKAVSFAAFLRLVATKTLLASGALMDVMQWMAVITMLVGNVAAILQNNLKRMLAYSSISHSGYLLVGVITAGVSDNWSFGASSVVFYLIGYTLMTLGAFAIVSMLENSENSVLLVDDLAGMAKKRPLMALSLTIFLLSLAGIPPALGFFGKFYLFNAAIGEGLLWLALWGVLNSVISVYYYLRPIVVMYMHEPVGDVEYPKNYATSMTVVSFALLVLSLGLISGALFSFVEISMSL